MPSGPGSHRSSRYAVLGENPEHRSSTGPVPRREDGLEDQLLRATLVSAETARPAYRSSPEDQVVLAPEFRRQPPSPRLARVSDIDIRAGL